VSDGPTRSPGIAVDILVEVEDWGDEADLRPLAERAVAATVAAGAFAVPDGAEVSVLFTDDTHIRALNRDFRGFDKPTNVLSFPGSDADLGPMLGDIAIARETVLREALDAGTPVEHHVTHLLVHGLLHLVGYDHEEEDEAETMERLETRILAGLGIPDPYADTVPDGSIETKTR
jgi:probable rRNA maturation factor